MKKQPPKDAKWIKTTKAQKDKYIKKRTRLFFINVLDEHNDYKIQRTRA